jgi:excisionase family DNA binding protein
MIPESEVAAELKRRSKLPSAPLPPEVASEAEADESIPTSQPRRANTARGPPLPPDIALAYRVNDAVKVSGLSRGTIYKLIAANKLRSVLLGGRRLIPVDALRELLRGAA